MGEVEEETKAIAEGIRGADEVGGRLENFRIDADFTLDEGEGFFVKGLVSS